MRRRRSSAAILLALALLGAVAPGGVLAADPVLVGAGDISDCQTSGDTATAKLLDGIAGTVFTVGDNVYDSGTAAEYRDCYGPTWGRHKSRTRPSAGNHEYESTDAAPYYAYFGAAAGKKGEGWYSYDRGTWHIVVLNSNCSDVGGCGRTSAQGKWLAADLKAYAGWNVLAIWHHPLFTSGEHGSTTEVKPLWDLLYAAGADVILNGHDHDYERFAPQDPGGRLDTTYGIREFVVGTGGRHLRSRSSDERNSQVFGLTFGVLKLTLRARSYDWKFVPVAGKTFTDSGTSKTHGPPSTPSTRSYFTASADAYVDQAHPTTKYGGYSRMLVDGDTGSGLDRESYIKVTVKGVGSRKVVRAALRLWVNDGTVDGPGVWPTSTSWSGSTIDWGNRPPSTGAKLSDAGRIRSNRWVDLDVTSLVRAGGDGTYGFRLRSGSADGLSVSSLEGPNKPRLVVDTVAP